MIFPGFLDLRAANFEFVGSADVDNPTVPNMIDYSTREPPFGHGINFANSLGVVVAIGAAASPGTLLRGKVPPNGSEYLRVPRGGLFDVMATGNTFQLNNPANTLCPQLLNVGMDRSGGWFLDDSPDGYSRSISRKVLTTLPDGRFVLQHTRTSANDFQRTPRTPGTVQR